MGALEFSGGLFVWSVITFGCLLLLLARFAFKPVAAALKDREDRIRDSLERAEKVRAQAEELLKSNDERIEEARDEARKIIREGHRIVSDMKHEARESAQREAELIANQARREIDRQLQQSLDELKGTVANLSVRVARQVIRGELDEQRHAQLADDFIERLKKSYASRKP
jgi:F-type H+-transporting ATPase subunit b